MTLYAPVIAFPVVAQWRVDISYYGKRRTTVIPQWRGAKPVCDTGYLTG